MTLKEWPKFTFSGKIGVGKTAIARHIIDSLPGWQMASFGDLVKQEGARAFRFHVSLAYNPRGKETLIRLPDGDRKTVRELRQQYGTDMVRARDRD